MKTRLMIAVIHTTQQLNQLGSGQVVSSQMRLFKV